MRAAPRYLQGGAGLPRPVLWAMVLLSLGAGVLGFVTGREVADLSETDVIAAYATRYAQETGGELSDCAAVPGSGAVWLIVHCGTGGDARSYRVARDGGQIRISNAPST